MTDSLVTQQARRIQQLESSLIGMGDKISELQRTIRELQIDKLTLTEQVQALQNKLDAYSQQKGTHHARSN